MSTLAGAFLAAAVLCSAVQCDGAKPYFELDNIYEGSRFPNVVVTTEGTVLAFRGANHPLQVRRSEDAGRTWSDIIEVGDEAGYTGAAVVDANTGDIIVFDHFIEHHSAYRSTDEGRSWANDDVTLHPDRAGLIGVTHGSDSGITLQHGEHAGRLIIASRSFGPEASNDRPWWPYHYTNAIYSDDGGSTWHTSDPFPVLGTGESVLVELRDGTLYYNTRSHTAIDAARRIGWSHDGGHTWVNPETDHTIPDGPRSDPYGLMAGLTRVPHDEYDILVYSNADTPGAARERMTVWLSVDGGRSWPVKRLVFDGPAAYSSLAAGRAGTVTEGLVFLQFEGGENHMYQGLKVARFNLAWMLDGKTLEEIAALSEQ